MLGTLWSPERRKPNQHKHKQRQSLVPSSTRGTIRTVGDASIQQHWDFFFGNTQVCKRLTNAFIYTGRHCWMNTNGDTFPATTLGVYVLSDTGWLTRI